MLSDHVHPDRTAAAQNFGYCSSQSAYDGMFFCSDYRSYTGRLYQYLFVYRLYGMDIYNAYVYTFF